MLRRAFAFGFLVVLASLLGRPVAAQSVAADPPGRVARLSELSGSGWFYHPDNGDWAEAVRNLPLTTGDRLATEPNSRAELQIGSTTLRLDGGSELEVVALDDSRIALQLHAGALTARIRSAAEAGQVDVLTDDGRFLVLRAGSYRFDRGTRSSFVLVDAGEVRYEYSSSALNVGPGQRGEFWIDANGGAQYALLAPVADAFAVWNADRDRGLDRSVATRYASPEMTGVEDLDRYGSWEQTPDYGAVWYPSAVAADWAPYSTGRWAWVRPWGWTWVDDAPWGFAPFHYGRWVNVRNRWCWTPGVRQPRPVWAPALVGWVGGGGPAGGPRGGAGPAVGWFPLAPREVYVPAYASTPRYIRSVNQPSVNNPALVAAAINDPRSARDFENRRFPHAVTVVPTTVLTERRPVGPPVAQFRNAPWARDFAQAGRPGAIVSATPMVAPPSFPAPGDAGRPPRPPPGFAEPRDGGRREGFADRDAQRPAVQGAAANPADPRGPLERGGRDRSGGPERFAPSPVGGAPGTGAAPARPIASPNAAPTQPPAPFAPPNVPPGIVRGNPPANSVIPPQRPAAEPEAPQSPRMRPLPVRREDDTRIPAGRPEPMQPVRPQFIPPPAPMAPVRPVEPQRPPERVAPVRPEIAAPRPVESPPQRVAPQRPPEIVAPRPVEAPQRVAPQRPPEPVAPRPVEAQRPAPAESPRVGAPERRNDPGATR